MKRFLFSGLLYCLPVLLPAQQVLTLDINGTINPVSAAYIHKGIEKARLGNASCVLIHLNTQGGLLSSTRDIVSDILQSPVPVIVFVAPSGAQSGSAGVFITMAAHIAAMAPGTNIGAAHPVNMEGDMDSVMSRKVTNDAAAFIRSIASKRNRNLQWAEDAVVKSLSITETEAVEKNVADLVAANDRDLLNKIDGKNMQLVNSMVTLHTRDAGIEVYEMSLTEELLNIISDPGISYMLMMLGFFGILFELYNPGAILPGIVGVIALILSMYSMHSLPVNYAGLALIVFAIVLFLLEIKIVSHGLLAAGGIVSLLLGSMMLIHSSSALESAGIPMSIIIAATTVTALFFLFVIGLGLKAQRLKVVTGVEAMTGAEGEVLTMLDPAGRVKTDGEVWNAISVSGNIAVGEKVRIRAIKDMTLYVEQINTEYSGSKN